MKNGRDIQVLHPATETVEDTTAVVVDEAEDTAEAGVGTRSDSFSKHYLKNLARAIEGFGHERAASGSLTLYRTGMICFTSRHCWER